MLLYGVDHPPGCDCGACSNTEPMVRLAEGLDNRWRKIPKDISDSFTAGVWQQKVLPGLIDRQMWQEHYTRFRNHAQAGWGKSFDKPSDLKEWEQFQRIEENLARFAAHKQHRVIEELRALMAMPGMTESKYKMLGKRVLQRHNVQWFKAELQATTATAQAAEAWAHFERRAYLYPNLRYDTSGDERVRESHRGLDGVVRSINDPFWDTYYPPNGWNCRCVVVQTDDPVTPDRDADFTPPKGFRGNAGKTGVTFSEDHPYFNVANLDKRSLEQQAKTFHASVTRQDVREWAKSQLVPNLNLSLPGMPQAATITNAEVNNITGKPHQYAASRNNLLYLLLSITGDIVSYIGTAPAEEANVVRWYYYLLETPGGRKYYLNFWERVEGTQTRIGLRAITDGMKRAP